jgi:hypothetical protein
MKPAEFLSLAGTLAVQTEASRLRTSISRAYYGAFHLTLEFLAGIEVPGGRDHDLHKPLLASGHQQARVAGVLISGLYDFRRRADYHLTDSEVELQSTARSCCEHARQIESLLQECAVEPARSEIKAGIERYLQQARPKAN